MKKKRVKSERHVKKKRVKSERHEEKKDTKAKQFDSVVESVDISPQVGVYAMFPSFSYKPWLAIAEFLDNSVTSFQANRPRLVSLHGPDFKLRLEISYEADKDQLVIRDNAYGIDIDHFAGAFALATPPEDLRFISRYGVGMKAAACWFAREWSVRTTALGEDTERTLNWVTQDIIDGRVQSLTPTVKKVDRNEHYTVITLKKLHHPPNGPKTVAKIKKYLPNIYREFMCDKEVELSWNGELMTTSQPEILVAPPQWDLEQPERIWEEKVVLNMAGGRTITGRVFLLKTMDRSYVALNLFWHNRLILGNIEPNHRPDELYGASNSAYGGRLCVELHMDEFAPTIDKTNFKFKDGESQLESIIEELKLQMQTSKIYRQASEYRVPTFDRKTLIPDIGPTIVIPAGEVVTEPAPPTPADPYPAPPISGPGDAPELREITKVVFSEDNLKWEIQLRQGVGPGDNEFVRIEEVPAVGGDEPHRLVVTLGGQHPFVLKYWSDDQEIQRVLLLLASAIGFGEIAARHAGAKYPSYVRNNIDRFLRLVIRHEYDDQEG